MAEQPEMSEETREALLLAEKFSEDEFGNAFSLGMLFGLTHMLRADLEGALEGKDDDAVEDAARRLAAMTVEISIRLTKLESAIMRHRYWEPVTEDEEDDGYEEQQG